MKNYSPQMVPVTQILGSGSWTNQLSRSETKCYKTDDFLVSSFLHMYACGVDTSVDQFVLKRVL